MCKVLNFSTLHNLCGERGILYRFYTWRKVLNINTLFFQKNAILPISVAILSQDKAL